MKNNDVVKKSFSRSFGIGTEKEYFIENIALFLSSGMPVTRALESIQEGLKTKKIKKYVAEIEEDVKKGEPFWKALADSRLFSSHLVYLVQIGEESGKLAENLEVVAKQQEKDRTFRSKLRSAMIYPVFIVFVAGTIGLGISWFVLPRLSTVFFQLDVDLPLATQILLSFGDILRAHGTVLVPVSLIFLFLIFYIIFFSPKAKIIGQTMMFNTPLIKRVIQEVEVARFGYLLGTLLDAGIPITNALDSLKRATSFPLYQRLYAHLQSSIEEGYSFKESFNSFSKTDKLIPPPVQQMVFSGEQTGNLKPTLLKIGKQYEEKTEITTKNLTVILEPVFLVIVWLGVVGIAFAVIMPIYEIVGGI